MYMYNTYIIRIYNIYIYIYVYLYTCIYTYWSVGQSVGRYSRKMFKNVEKSPNNVEMLVITGTRS